MTSCLKIRVRADYTKENAICSIVHKQADSKLTLRSWLQILNLIKDDKFFSNSFQSDL